MKTETVAVPKTKWEDIIFEHRNKNYGAYVLRTGYSKNVSAAVGIALALVVLLFALPYIIEFLTPKEVVDKTELKQKVVSLDQPPPITPNQPPPPKLDIPPPVKTIKYVAPKVTTKEVVEEEMPTIEEIKTVEVSTETVEGPATVVFEEPAPAVVESDETKIYEAVEQPPSYEGGLAAMAKFLQKNMKYPSQARRMGVEGKVFIQFVVNREGKISDVALVKGIGAGCDEEAQRVVGIMPPWRPGKQNGKAVNVRYIIPINFTLE